MFKRLEAVSVYLCIFIGLWSVWLHFVLPLDNELQKFFFIDGHWLVDENEPVLKWLLYRIPKIVCVVAGAASVFLLGLCHFRKISLSKQRRAGLLTFVITIVLYPALVALLKEILRQPCPRDLIEYGGTYGGSMWDYFAEHGSNRCFPGAHASAPFSFLALAYLFEEQADRMLFLFVVLPFAFFIGFYQVAKGAHFVSDTICTAAFSWVFVSLVHHGVLKIKKRTQGPPF